MGDKFYIILQGFVSLWAPEDKTPNNNTIKEEKQTMLTFTKQAKEKSEITVEKIDDFEDQNSFNKQQPETQGLTKFFPQTSQFRKDSPRLNSDLTPTNEEDKESLSDDSYSSSSISSSNSDHSNYAKKDSKQFESGHFITQSPILQNESYQVTEKDQSSPPRQYQQNPPLQRKLTRFNSNVQKIFLQNASPLTLQKQKLHQSGVQDPDEQETLYFVERGKLMDGRWFGDNALINNKPFTATVKCETNCHLAFLDRIEFMKCLDKFEKKKINKGIEFFRGLECFKGWTRNYIRNFINNQVEERKYSRNEIVYKQGSDANSVFIVKKGDFEMYQDIPKQFSKGSGYIRSFLGQRQGRAHLLIKKLPEIQDYPQQFRVVCYGVGTMMGEEDVINREKYSCSVKCSTLKGKLYIINKDNFLKLQYKEKAWNYIIEQVGVKEQRLQGQNIADISRDAAQYLKQQQQQEIQETLKNQSKERQIIHRKMNFSQSLERCRFREITKGNNLISDYKRLQNIEKEFKERKPDSPLNDENQILIEKKKNKIELKAHFEHLVKQERNKFQVTLSSGQEWSLRDKRSRNCRVTGQSFTLQNKTIASKLGQKRLELSQLSNFPENYKTLQSKLKYQSKSKITMSSARNYLQDNQKRYQKQAYIMNTSNKSIDMKRNYSISNPGMFILSPTSKNNFFHNRLLSDPDNTHTNSKFQFLSYDSSVKSLHINPNQ